MVLGIAWADFMLTQRFNLYYTNRTPIKPRNIFHPTVIMSILLLYLKIQTGITIPEITSDRAI
jgi:hypothetical protein